MKGRALLLLRNGGFAIVVARSAHFVLAKGVKYKDLGKVYPELLGKFLEATHQMPEEPELVRMLIRADQKDLEKNRKPEGYNRQGKVRLIFPLTDNQVKFYIYRGSRSEEIGLVAEQLSKVLSRRRLKHRIEWDLMVLYREKEAKGKKPPEVQHVSPGI